MRILFLSRWFPYPMDNGSKLRIYNLLRGLAMHHDVTLLSFTDQPEVSLGVSEIRAFCGEVHVIRWREFDPISMRARFGFLSLKPRSIIDTFSPEMAGKITQLLNVRQYDLVIASQLSMAAYYPYFKHVPALFEELEIGLSLEDSRRTLNWLKRFRHTVTWFKLRGYLAQLLRFFQAVTVVSNREKELVQRNFSSIKDIQVIPNCVNVADYREIRVEPRLYTLIFTGSFRYHTNYEAMQWFVGQVFPLVLERIPSAHLIITGDHAGLPLPSIRNVTLAGHVNDIKGLIASSTVALAPLWSGGGTRLKILEAMAIGTPVVATTKGAEGLDAQIGEHLFVTDDPNEFAGYVIKLLAEQILRESMTSRALELVRKKYDWAGVMPDFLKLVEDSGRR